MNIFQLVDEQVDIFDVASRAGLSWGENPGRPIQIHCPMHSDSTPSARLYPASNSLYCWTCQQSAGPVRLLAVTEGIGMGHAAHVLAARYSVDLTPDADLEEFQALAQRYEDGPPTDTPETRRAAGLTVRAVGRPWPQVEALLPLWDALDTGAIKPTDWLNLVRQHLSVEQAEA